jgi:hypothetical protein
MKYIIYLIFNIFYQPSIIFLSPNKNIMSTFSFSSNSDFPPKSSYIQNIAVVLINSANLISATNDAKNLPKLYVDKLNFSHVYMLFDNDSTLNQTKSTLTSYTNITYAAPQSKNDLLLILLDILNNLENTYCVLHISSHGYCSGFDNNYLIWNTNVLTDIEINTTFTTALNSKANTFLVVLADACQTGTICNLNYKTLDLINYESENNTAQNTNIICISAVSDQQYDPDDISDLGFDGGLTSGLIDYFYELYDNKPTIGDFFKYYTNRIGPLGLNSILSFNLKSFIEKN